MTVYNYQRPCAPAYRQPSSVEDCLPQARLMVKKEHGRTAMGPVADGDRILIVTLPDQDAFVAEAVIQACQEAGADGVRFIYPEELTGEKVQTRSVEEGWKEAEMLQEGIASGSPETADLASGQNVAEHLYNFLDEHQEYTRVFWDLGARGQKRSVLKEYQDKFKGNWLGNNWEEFSSRAWTYPDELTAAIERRIIDVLGEAAAVRITDPEGTFLEYPLSSEEAKRWQISAPCPGHLFLDPLQATSEECSRVPVAVPPVFRDLNGVMAGTSNHRGFFPRMELAFEHGRLVDVKGGGKYGEMIEEMKERYEDVHWPEYPDKGYFWYCDCALCTMVKSFRRTSDMFRSHWGFPNLGERNRAGVFHMGIGSRRGSKEHLAYAKARGLPLGHIHVHNYFATFEIRRRGTNDWHKIVDKGWVTAMSDPEVRAIACKYGEPDELLSYDWVPPLPGVNCEGDYFRDYAPDPMSYLKKRLQGGQII